jgi:hypothetical protein
VAVVKETAMEILVLVLALVALDVAVQLFGADSRRLREPERERR